MTTYAIVSYRQTRDVPEHTWTVGELVEYLSGLDQDARIVVSGYDGNLYNSVDCETIEEVEE